MSLADKVHAEQAAVTAGATACGATHPADEVESDCVRLVHLPADDVHVGTVDGGLIQWQEPPVSP